MPFRFDASVSIERPRDEVWAFLANHDNQLAWRRDVLSVALVFGEPMAIGARYQYEIRGLFRTLVVAVQLMEVVEGERFLIQTLTGPVDLEAVTELSASDSATTVRISGRGRLRGLARALELAGPLLGWRSRRSLVRDLAALKRALEAAA